MGKREKDKTRKRKTQRLFSHPKKETSFAFGVPYRFDRLGSARIPLRHGGSTPKMTSRSPRIMSAPELKISTANDVPAILHDGPDGVPQSGHSVSKGRLSLSTREMNDHKDTVNNNDNEEACDTSTGAEVNQTMSGV